MRPPAGRTSTAATVRFTSASSIGGCAASTGGSDGFIVSVSSMCSSMRRRSTSSMRADDGVQIERREIARFAAAERDQLTAQGDGLRRGALHRLEVLRFADRGDHVREIGGDAAGDARHVLPPARPAQLRFQRALGGDVLGHDFEALAVAVRALEQTAVQPERERLTIAIQPARVERLAPADRATAPRASSHSEASIITPRLALAARTVGRRVVSKHCRHRRIQIQQPAFRPWLGRCRATRPARTLRRTASARSRSPSAWRIPRPGGSTPHRAETRRRAAASPAPGTWLVRYRRCDGDRLRGRAAAGAPRLWRRAPVSFTEITTAVSTGASAARELEELDVGVAGEWRGLPGGCAAASSVTCSTTASSRLRSVTSRRTMSAKASVRTPRVTARPPLRRTRVDTVERRDRDLGGPRLTGAHAHDEIRPRLAPLSGSRAGRTACEQLSRHCSHRAA